MTTVPIKLISPGIGSSGYYPAETLRQAAEDGIFKRGTQMFWVTPSDHAMRTEDPNRLAAVLESDAEYLENGRDGAGLYATANIFSDFESLVTEKAKHMGLSIVGEGQREVGTLPDGREGLIVTEITNGYSVDFVTKAGRDGKVLFESADGAEDKTLLHETVLLIEAESTQNHNDDGQTQESAMDKLAEAKSLLVEANAKIGQLEKQNAVLTEANASMRQKLILAEAKEIVVGVWREEKYKDVPQGMRDLFESSTLSTLPMNDGKLDKAKLLESVRSSAGTYISTLPASQNGSVIGNGEGEGGFVYETFIESEIKRLAGKHGMTEAQARAVLGGA